MTHLAHKTRSRLQERLIIHRAWKSQRLAESSLALSAQVFDCCENVRLSLAGISERAVGSR
jgi:hypothetical protein